MLKDVLAGSFLDYIYLIEIKIPILIPFNVSVLPNSYENINSFNNLTVFKTSLCFLTR